MGTTALPSVKAEDGDLGPGEELLDDDAGCRCPRRPCPPCMARTASSRLLPGHGRSVTPLPRARPSALTTVGMGAVFRYSRAVVRVVKDLVLGRGDVVFFHQVLGKDLAALDGWRPPCRGRSRGCPRPPAASTHPRTRGSSGATTAKSMALSCGKGGDGVQIRGPDAGADRRRRRCRRCRAAA